MDKNVQFPGRHVSYWKTVRKWRNVKLPLFIVDTGQVSMYDCIVGAQVECPQVSCYRSATNKRHITPPVVYHIK
jgi:hypothetical protein